MSRTRAALSTFCSITSDDTRRCATGLLAITSVVTLSIAASSSPAKNEYQKDHSDKLDIYLMDRIARKSYLNNPLNSKRHHNRAGASDKDVELNITTSRPKGVPTRLRILAIDVPNFKTDAFKGGICQEPSKIFEGVDGPLFKDGVARSKRIDQVSLHENQSRKERRESRRPIEQKSLAKKLYYCYGRGKQSDTKASVKNEEIEPVIGAEILEASIMNLNPNNIRRTYTSKTAYRYDPGKYSDVESLRRHETDSGIADVDEATEIPEDEETPEMNKEPIISSDDREEQEDEDTRNAPWNQYAWLEEIRLRIHGLVPFNAPMQRSSFLSYNIFGRVYQQIVPSSMSYIRWLFSWSLWGGNISSVEGADGEGECALYDDTVTNYKAGRASAHKLNRASNKPHAVIADGAAMQRVPGSLRFLTKVCRDANVPLYILNDPRSWGRLSSSSYSTLGDALADLRRTVTDDVVDRALELREGSAFERGRFVGRWEKEIEWQARDAGRKTRQTWLDAKQRWKKERMEDWSELSEDELRAKLVEKKVLNGENEYSEGLTNICQHCATKSLSGEDKPNN